MIDRFDQKVEKLQSTDDENDRRDVIQQRQLKAHIDKSLKVVKSEVLDAVRNEVHDAVRNEVRSEIQNVENKLDLVLSKLDHDEQWLAYNQVIAQTN